ncbi:DUF948 domain-containing protein [Metabacillus sp. GX 13764]|uniref:DUF948 domain-containing protein n=1 Tax=Metabacillus kandeliae TaxID=2900151 RepID=UPI001E5A7EC9|nr:DUF948 domain-containing protein [Metabacillus kandeliae]MCD7036020.1 DUF948 domain-containing protein [Metabacillus kandeliae]
MIIQLCIAAVTIGFLLLTVYLIQTLRKGMVTLNETKKTLAEVRHAVGGISIEAEQFIQTANQVTEDVKDKMKTVDPLLESVQDVGEVLHNVTSSVRTKRIPSETKIIDRRTIEQKQNKPVRITWKQ